MLRVIGARAKTVTYLHQERNSSNQAGYTFSDVPLGAEHSSRIILIGVSLVHGSSDGIATVRIDGVDCTMQVEARVGPTPIDAQLWSLAVPTGTTADVSVTIAGGGNAISCSIAVWSLLHFKSATAHDADGDFGGVASLSVAVPNRGAVVGYAYSGNGPITWTGDSLARDFTAGTSTSTGAHSGASLADMSSTASYGVTVDGVGSGATFAVLTSWS